MSWRAMVKHGHVVKRSSQSNRVVTSRANAPARHLTGRWNKIDRIGRWVECNRTVLTQNSPSASALLTTATYQSFWRLSCPCQNRTDHQTPANMCQSFSELLPLSHLETRSFAEFFPGWATSTFCWSFSGCWQCNANGRSQNTLLFYTTALPLVELGGSLGR